VNRVVVVVGGGVSGLVAAWRLAAGGDLDIAVLEQTGACGGKLRSGELGGLGVDLGAESVLARRPEALDLFGELGLGGDVVHPVTSTASVFSRGRLHPLPGGTVMGVPRDPAVLRGLLTVGELARVAAEAELPASPVEADVDVGTWIAARFGRPLVDRLVEPLLGGVYAGRADDLSLEATLPQLALHARRERSLLAAARASRSAADAGSQDGAVFGAPRGGVGRLPAAVARLSGATVRTGATVRELSRTPDGWRLVVGPTRSPEEVLADAVVLAVPAAPTARLLRPHAAAAASELTQIRYSSMAVVALAFPATAFPSLPTGSGFLVPPVEGRSVKAVTFSSTKWGWYAGAAPGLVVVRASVGRMGEEAVLQRDDADLVDLVLADLTDALGVTDPPLDARVTRWGGGLPQYTVGHRGRVERIRAAVAGLPGLAVAGAAYDGVGVPACVASGAQAALEVLRQWRA
jgi:oxygen-dependent protoporphyrinogen oxidase